MPSCLSTFDCKVKGPTPSEPVLEILSCFAAAKVCDVHGFADQPLRVDVISDECALGEHQAEICELPGERSVIVRLPEGS